MNTVRSMPWKKRIWWLCVPLATGLLSWGPYILLNVLHGAPWSAWRVPFVPIVLFDASAYFEWLGAAMAGWDAGQHIGWFGQIGRALGWIIPASWNLAETWILTLWISVTAGLWLLAQSMKEWSGLSARQSRLLSLLAWCSLILPFMPRPGVLTWYLPFYVFGLIGVWYVHRLLDERRWIVAALWTVASVLACLTYPYYAVHLLFWMAAIWLVCLHTNFRHIVRIVGVIGIICVAPMALGVFFLYASRIFVILQQLEQTGLAFTRLPVISGSLALSFAGALLVGLTAHLTRAHPDLQKRLEALFIGWIALILAWLSNLFTGVYIHSDHFRSPAVVLAWLTVAVMWRAAQDASFSDDARIIHRWLSAALIAVSVVALTWFVGVKHFVLNGDYLNIINASHAVALLLGSVIVWGLARRVPLRKWTWAIAILAVVLGLWARAALFARETQQFQALVPSAAVLTWIHEHVPKNQAVCSDPLQAEILGSFSGRMAHPTVATQLRPISQSENDEDLRAYLGVYNASAAGMGPFFLDQANAFRGTTCAQFGKLRSVWPNASAATWDDLMDCPSAEMENAREGVRMDMMQRQMDPDRFRALCPYVVVGRDQKIFWSLPATYHAVASFEDASIWRAD